MKTIQLLAALAVALSGCTTTRSFELTLISYEPVTGTEILKRGATGISCSFIGEESLDAALAAAKSGIDGSNGLANVSVYYETTLYPLAAKSCYRVEADVVRIKTSAPGVTAPQVKKTVAPVSKTRPDGKSHRGQATPRAGSPSGKPARKGIKPGYYGCVTHELFDEFMGMMARGDSTGAAYLVSRNSCIQMRGGLPFSVLDTGWTGWAKIRIYSVLSASVHDPNPLARYGA